MAVARKGYRYVHKKRGTEYELIGTAQVRATEPLTDYEVVVVYKSVDDGQLWVRRRSEFCDGRFVATDSSLMTEPKE